MARSPRAKVSSSSGQGVSRLSYQKGRSLGNKGTASPATSDTKFSTESGSSSRSYKKGDYPNDMNVSYGATLHPSTLKDVQILGKGSPPDGWKPTETKSRRIK